MVIHTSQVPVLEREKQRGCEFQAGLSHTVRPCHKKQKTTILISGYIQVDAI